MIERAGRIAAPAAVALFVVIGIFLSEQSVTVAVAAGFIAVATCVALAALSVDGWPLVAGLAVSGVAVTVVCDGNPANLGWFAICVLAGWCALRAQTIHSATLTGLLAAILVAQWLAVSDEPGWGAWIAGTIFATVVCLMTSRQRDLIEQLREAQAGLAERTRAEERNRIAGEMHDVIGHALTVSLLHVSSARLALDEDPEEARTSLEEAERLGQQSLAEVRQAVGMLREHTSTRTPMPHAAQLPDLVEAFRRAGRIVELEIDGDPSSLTTTSGLAVYRIVQEALTNVVRHASPSATTWIRLQIAPEETRLTIEDDGGATNRSGDGSGVGVIGMRERAEAVGGRLTAGPAGLGWRVEAVLPSAHLEVG
jgi:signal transduction histidine kinase